MRQQFQWWIPAMALMSLGAMQAWKLTLPPMESGASFRTKVAGIIVEANKQLMVGDWSGTEQPLPLEAQALLHTYGYMSRSYKNIRTREAVGFMFIEVEESRDMMGHYPPNCYPGDGWELVRKVPASNELDKDAVWVVGDLRIKGTEYEFKRKEKDGLESRKWVRSFFILPNNTFYAEIGSFGRAASDFYIRPYGATQVQVIYDREYLPEDRERIFEDLISAHKDLIEAVRKKD